MPRQGMKNEGDSIALVRPQMTVLRTDAPGLSAFGILSQAFSAAVIQRAQIGLGGYGMYSLELASPESESGSTVISPVFRLDLSVILQQMQRETLIRDRETEKHTERILRRALELRGITQPQAKAVTSGKTVASAETVTPAKAVTGSESGKTVRSAAAEQAAAAPQRASFYQVTQNFYAGILSGGQNAGRPAVSGLRGAVAFERRPEMRMGIITREKITGRPPEMLFSKVLNSLQRLELSYASDTERVPEGPQSRERLIRELAGKYQEESYVPDFIEAAGRSALRRAETGGVAEAARETAPVSGAEPRSGTESGGRRPTIEEENITREVSRVLSITVPTELTYASESETQSAEAQATKAQTTKVQSAETQAAGAGGISLRETTAEPYREKEVRAAIPPEGAELTTTEYTEWRRFTTGELPAAQLEYVVREEMPALSAETPEQRASSQGARHASSGQTVRSEKPDKAHMQPSEKSDKAHTQPSEEPDKVHTLPAAEEDRARTRSETDTAQTFPAELEYFIREEDGRTRIRSDGTAAYSAERTEDAGGVGRMPKEKRAAQTGIGILRRFGSVKYPIPPSETDARSPLEMAYAQPEAPDAAARISTAAPQDAAVNSLTAETFLKPEAADSQYIRSLPDWTQEFLKSGYEPAPTVLKTGSGEADAAPTKTPPGGEDAGAGNRPLQSIPEEEPTQERQMVWSNPTVAPPPAAATTAPPEMKLKTPETRTEAQDGISDAEIKRAANRVYRIIEDRLRHERRRLGL